MPQRTHGPQEGCVRPSAAALAFDSTRNRYVLFGGAGAPPAGSTDFPFLGDTWETFDPAAPSLES